MSRIFLDEILGRYVHLLVYQREVPALPAALQHEFDQLRGVLHTVELNVPLDCDGDGRPDDKAIFKIDPTTGSACCRVVTGGKERVVTIEPLAASGKAAEAESAPDVAAAPADDLKVLESIPVAKKDRIR